MSENEQTEEAEEPTNHFMTMLPDLRAGGTVTDLELHLKKTLGAVLNRGGSGSVTLKVNFKKKGEGQLEIDADVDSKQPKPAKEVSLRYLAPDGRLTRDNPRQREFGFTSSEGPKVTVEEGGADAPAPAPAAG